ncbi:MAG: ATP-binding protein [Pseudohongiellaceae bacterium]
MKKTETTTEYSLQTRLLFAVSILLFIFLGLTGMVLDRAFRDSIEAGVAEQLQLQIYLLLAYAEEEGGEFYFLEDLREPRFGRLNSGLYGFISSAVEGELWRSDSALDLQFQDNQVLQQHVATGETAFTTIRSADNEQLFAVSYGILWEDGESEYTFTVMETSEPYLSEISGFRASLWSWLGGVAVLLLALQLILMRWGLSPLHRMAKDLKLIESGEREQLEGVYPRELRGVANNLNLLIKTERKQQARYRTTLGDLAHSLKTPLAVITGLMENLFQGRGEVLSGDVKQQVAAVEEQLERMNQIVSYQLQRAVTADSSSTLARQVRVAAVIRKILDALVKVYADKQVHYELDLDETVIFPGDERDLMEIVGNIVDNAFKYGSSMVRITAGVAESAKTCRELVIFVEDDGPGIAPDKRQFVLQRGARADTLATGQGIGLAVVTDIIGSYNGSINVGESDLGGASIEVRIDLVISPVVVN